LLHECLRHIFNVVSNKQTLACTCFLYGIYTAATAAAAATTVAFTAVTTVTDTATMTTIMMSPNLCPELSDGGVWLQEP
jgi:hypothetical protein